MIQTFTNTVRPVVMPSHVSERRNEPARLFDDAAADYLELGSAVLTAAPLTMACWCKLDDLAVDSTLMALGNSGAAHYFSMLYDAPNNNMQFHLQEGISSIKVNATIDATVGRWHHVAAVEASTISHTIYMDAGHEATSTTSRIPASIDITSIGILSTNSRTLTASGRIFWPCFWNVALTKAEIERLANYAPPWEVRPESIVSLVNMKTLYDPYAEVQWTRSGTKTINPYRAWTPPWNFSRFMSIPRLTDKVQLGVDDVDIFIETKTDMSGYGEGVVVLEYLEN